MDFAELAVSGLASMYPAFDWSVAPGHHGYQRACELIMRQVIATWLIAETGSNLAPSFYLIVTSHLSLAVLVTIRMRIKIS